MNPYKKQHTITTVSQAKKINIILKWKFFHLKIYKAVNVFSQHPKNEWFNIQPQWSFYYCKFTPLLENKTGKTGRFISKILEMSAWEKHLLLPFCFIYIMHKAVVLVCENEHMWLHFLMDIQVKKVKVNFQINRPNRNPHNFSILAGREQS